MANFTKATINNDCFRDSDCYYVSGALTEEDIRRINLYPKKIVLILKNTRGQNSELIKSITSKNIQFSVIGGLDYLNKKKFNASNYINRTIIEPKALAMIIEFFEKIEKQLRYSWTDTQKCLFIFTKLAKYLHYKYDNESEYEGDKDVVRSLYGVLYGKLVCSGFALVFKEILDRIGIKNYYQNMKGSHSWNIVELDGKLRPIELTWACCTKRKDGIIDGRYFGTDPDFYANEYHNISNDPEETKFQLVPFSAEEIVENSRIIKQNPNTKIGNMDYLIDRNCNKIYYMKIKDINNIKIYMVYLDNCLIPIYSDLEPQDCLSREKIQNAFLYNNNFITSLKSNYSNGYQTYRRKDGSSFIIEKNRVLRNSIIEHYYYDAINVDGKVTLRRNVILSELDLSLNYDDNIRNIIANDLLLKERLQRKISHYHGYVGYFGNGGVYYDRNFEINELNIAKRA